MFSLSCHFLRSHAAERGRPWPISNRPSRKRSCRCPEAAPSSIPTPLAPSPASHASRQPSSMSSRSSYSSPSSSPHADDNRIELTSWSVWPRVWRQSFLRFQRLNSKTNSRNGSSFLPRFLTTFVITCDSFFGIASSLFFFFNVEVNWM